MNQGSSCQGRMKKEAKDRSVKSIAENTREGCSVWIMKKVPEVRLKVAGLHEATSRTPTGKERAQDVGSCGHVGRRDTEDDS